MNNVFFTTAATTANASTTTLTNWAQILSTNSTAMTSSHYQQFFCDRPLDEVVLRRRRIAIRPSLQPLLQIGGGDVPRGLLIRHIDGFEMPRQRAAYAMPDGSVIAVDELGNYKIEDSDAKVIYQANRVREFNPYVSASDLLEKFIREVGQLDGIDQGEILRLPIEPFINWLILQAAKRDGDSTKDLPSVEEALPKQLALPAPSWYRPRCDVCKRFIKKTWADAKIAFCSPAHMQLRLAKL